MRDRNRIGPDGRRTANGRIALLMPQSVVVNNRQKYSKAGKIHHRAELARDTDYTIVQRYQSVLRGLYNFYCMATNVGNTGRMQRVKWDLSRSLVKTLANKHKTTGGQILRRYKVKTPEGRPLIQATLARPGKETLVATFGGIPFIRKPDGINGLVDVSLWSSWINQGNFRSELVDRILAGKCELCESQEGLQVHHIRKLADLTMNGRKPTAPWEKVMSARRRKTLVVCKSCHNDIHAGRYDGPSYR